MRLVHSRELRSCARVSFRRVIRAFTARRYVHTRARPLTCACVRESSHSLPRRDPAALRATRSAMCPRPCRTRRRNALASSERAASVTLADEILPATGASLRFSKRETRQTKPIGKSAAENPVWRTSEGRTVRVPREIYLKNNRCLLARFYYIFTRNKILAFKRHKSLSLKRFEKCIFCNLAKMFPQR